MQLPQQAGKRVPCRRTGEAPGSGRDYFHVAGQHASADGRRSATHRPDAGPHDRDLRAGGRPAVNPRSANPRNGVRGGPLSGPELVTDAVAKPVSVNGCRRALTQQAVVLAGVDASAGVSSQGDPRPVLLRITGPAWTAAPSGSGDGTAMQVGIDGCTVTGAAHGDLSSEKVYVRFRTMTCAGPEPGTVIETDVAGFVAGSGKTGVRGPVVSREGALVEKAFLAGLVSGVGQGVAGAFQPQAVATGGGAAVANTGLGDIGRAGLGAGASSAGQKVADYMIRRAEQYQPVVQLQAGTKVTLVFLEGARIGGEPRPGGRAPQPNTAEGGN